MLAEFNLMVLKSLAMENVVDWENTVNTNIKPQTKFKILYLRRNVIDTLLYCISTTYREVLSVIISHSVDI